MGDIIINKPRYYWKPAEIEAACKAYCSLVPDVKEVEVLREKIVDKVKLLAPKDCASGTYHLRGDRIYPYIRDNVFPEIRTFVEALMKVEKDSPENVSSQQKINMGFAIYQGKTKVMDYSFQTIDAITRWRFYSAWLILRKLPVFAPPFALTNDQHSKNIQQQQDGGVSSSERRSKVKQEGNLGAKYNKIDGTTMNPITPHGGNVPPSQQQSQQIQAATVDTEGRFPIAMRTCAAAAPVPAMMNPGVEVNLAASPPIITTTTAQLPAAAASSIGMPHTVVPTYALFPPQMQIGATMKAMASFQHAAAAAMHAAAFGMGNHPAAIPTIATTPLYHTPVEIKNNNMENNNRTGNNNDESSIENHQATTKEDASSSPSSDENVTVDVEEIINRKRKRDDHDDDGNDDDYENNNEFKKLHDLVTAVQEIKDIMRKKNNVHILSQAIHIARDPTVKKRLEDKLINLADNLEF